jgi:hypothetical protein
VVDFSYLESEGLRAPTVRIPTMAYFSMAYLPEADELNFDPLEDAELNLDRMDSAEYMQDIRSSSRLLTNAAPPDQGNIETATSVLTEDWEITSWLKDGCSDVVGRAPSTHQWVSAAQVSARNEGRFVSRSP